MTEIIGRPRVGNNRDGPMTPGHRRVCRRGQGGRVPKTPGRHRRRQGAGTGEFRMSRDLARQTRSIVAAAGAALLLASFAVGSAAAGGPPAPGFYVDDHLYRTVGTPTDLSGTGAPAQSFDR